MRLKFPDMTASWGAYVVACGCAVFILACDDEAPPESNSLITLQVTSALRTCVDVGRGSCIDAVRVYTKSRDGAEQSFTEPLGTRDIVSEPKEIFLTPSPSHPRGDEGFLIRIDGLSRGIRLVSASGVITFDSSGNQRMGFNMTEQFVGCDIDGDGIESCLCLNAPSCDCNDQSAAISPFAAEACGDAIDSNCDGLLDPSDSVCATCWDKSGTRCSDLTVEQGAGVGACNYGLTACDERSGETYCLGAGEPSDEIIDDGIDNNCDGSVDEGGECNDGDTRDCLRGFVGSAARNRARGVCTVGVQTCTGSVWAACAGDERGEFEELACDGIDEDCDGKVDELERFDSDGDGFTICGTCATDRQRAVVDSSELPRLDGSAPLVCGAAIDCDDDPQGQGRVVFPGNAELCTTAYDDDCRCDHDDIRFGGSTIGMPVMRLDGGTNCDNQAAGLRCDILPRSDSAPSGLCNDSDSGGPYFDGVFDIDGTMSCYGCAAPFGLSCDVRTGACALDRGSACAACDAPLPPDPDLLDSSRPVCRSHTGGCSGQSGATWGAAAAGDDPYGDCEPGMTCDGAGTCVVPEPPQP